MFVLVLRAATIHPTESTVYNPIKDGIEKSAKSVIYLEARPPNHLHELVHCYWELKTLSPLSEDFHYHILPDACVNLLFDQLDKTIAAITAIQKTSLVLNLGRDFHFAGIQLLPGVWHGDPTEIKSDLVNQTYLGSLPLRHANERLIEANFEGKQRIFSNLVDEYVEQKLIVSNPITQTILSHLNEILSVKDMARLTGLSPRQLQRKLKESTGFSPHDFLKVLRLQQSFGQHYLDYYSDQAHFIHSFKKITGYTPTGYNKKFDV